MTNETILARALDGTAAELPAATALAASPSAAARSLGLVAHAAWLSEAAAPDAEDAALLAASGNWAAAKRTALRGIARARRELRA